MWLGNPKAVLLLSGTVGSRDSHKVIRMLLSLYLSPLPSSVLTSLLVGLGLLSHCSDSLQSHKASGLLLSSPHICASNPPKALWPWMSREPLNSSPKLKWVCMRVGGGVSWLTVPSEPNKIKEAEVPHGKAVEQPPKNRHHLQLQILLSGCTVISFHLHI